MTYLTCGHEAVDTGMTRCAHNCPQPRVCNACARYHAWHEGHAQIPPLDDAARREERAKALEEAAVAFEDTDFATWIRARVISWLDDRAAAERRGPTKDDQ